jgi:uncharacterized cupredoxin-like copper-binding protein
MKTKSRIVAGLLVGSVTLAVMAGLGIATASAATMPAPVKITVQAGEFYFKLSKTSIPKPGTVKFTVTNKGTIAHDFSIQALNKTTKLLQPKQSQVLTVTFKKPGNYYYLCLVPRHAQEGMAGDFTVK